MDLARFLGSRALRFALLCVSTASLLSPLAAQAVPAFARQTGQNCVACHAGGNFPDLTPYGRIFKLTGYTIGERALPLSAMAVASYNKTNNTSEVGGLVDVTATYPKDGNVIFSTASLFLAGKVTDNIGGFVQITYNNYDHQNEDSHWVGHTVSDNLDIRYADRLIDPKQDLIFGATMNNNPGVQDPWNSTPAWGYNVVPGSTGPATTPLLAGGLAQNVAGAGAYVYWDRTIYAELSGYATANGVWSFMSHGFNTGRGDQQIVKGTNPYWRLALTREWGPDNAMIGTFGMNTDLYPDANDPSGPTDHFRDIGFDAQYQYLLDPHTVTATATYITEKHIYASTESAPLDPDGSLGLGLPDTSGSDKLDMFRAKVSYVYQAKYGGSLSFFNVTGSANTALQTAANDPNNPGTVAGEPLGSLNGSPATRGWTAEATWTPLQNARIGLQYTWFNKFNGGTNNYDGFGRNASDNNTLFLYVWGAI